MITKQASIHLSKAVVVSSLIGLSFFYFSTTSEAMTTWNLLGNVLYSLSIGLPMFYQGTLLQFVNKRMINWIDHPGRSALLSLLIHVFSSLVVIGMVVGVWHVWIFGQTWFEVCQSSSLRLHCLLLFGINFLITLLYHAKGFLEAFRHSAVETERLKQEAQLLQYEVAQQQVNPHFLFNSLNTAQTLVDIDAEKSKAYLSNLSRFYRDLLTFQKEELVPLQREVEFVTRYVFIQSIRFGNNFTVEFSVSNHSDSFLVPMTLQTLIENAVKHNEISSAHPLHVRVEVREAKLCVTNAIRLKRLKEKSTGTGLASLSKRYLFLTNQGIEVQNDSNQYKVSVPLVQSGGKRSRIYKL